MCYRFNSFSIEMRIHRGELGCCRVLNEVVSDDRGSNNHGELWSLVAPRLLVLAIACSIISMERNHHNQKSPAFRYENRYAAASFQRLAGTEGPLPQVVAVLQILLFFQDFRNLDVGRIVGIEAVVKLHVLARSRSAQKLRHVWGVVRVENAQVG